jgi:hypothetical protein
MLTRAQYALERTRGPSADVFAQVMSLKATLFETEEELKTSADGSNRRAARQPSTGGNLLAKSNKGLIERDRKAAEQEQMEQSQRQERMKMKVETYQKLGRFIVGSYWRDDWLLINVVDAASGQISLPSDAQL